MVNGNITDQGFEGKYQFGWKVISTFGVGGAILLGIFVYGAYSDNENDKFVRGKMIELATDSTRAIAISTHGIEKLTDVIEEVKEQGVRIEKALNRNAETNEDVSRAVSELSGIAENIRRRN